MNFRYSLDIINKFLTEFGVNFRQILDRMSNFQTILDEIKIKLDKIRLKLDNIQSYLDNIQTTFRQN